MGRFGTQVRERFEIRLDQVFKRAAEKQFEMDLLLYFTIVRIIG